MNGTLVSVIIVYALLFDRTEYSTAAARAYFSFRSEFIVCGIPANFALGRPRESRRTGRAIRVIYGALINIRVIVTIPAHFLLPRKIMHTSTS